MKRLSLEFIEADKPITDLVTKFGGQPVWLDKIAWPISKTTRNPMRFICQIKLDKDIFGNKINQMAYVFMTDEDNPDAKTWDPESGDNAVIIQPNSKYKDCKEITNGPTLYRMIKKPKSTKLVEESCEFNINYKTGNDPEYVNDDERSNEHTLDGNKIGGTPNFIQDEAFPFNSECSLLLQLDSTQVPFYINFGDAGVGYIFLSADLKTAKFLWQSS